MPSFFPPFSVQIDKDATKMLLNVSLPQLLFLPPLLLLVSGLALFNFQTLFRFLSVSTWL